jgi:cation transport ATPase
MWLHCASCVKTIERALWGVTGVTEASVNPATARVQVVGRGLKQHRLIDAVHRSGYYAKPAGEEKPWQAEHRAARALRLMRRRALIAAALTLPVLVVSIADIRFPNRSSALLLLTLPVYLYAGWPFLSGMVRTFHHRTATNMDTCVGLVTTAALLLSVGSTFFPRAFATAGAAHAYYAVVGFMMTLRLSASFWIGGFGARGRRCPDCILRGR